MSPSPSAGCFALTVASGSRHAQERGHVIHLVQPAYDAGCTAISTIAIGNHIGDVRGQICDVPFINTVLADQHLLKRMHRDRGPLEVAKALDSAAVYHQTETLVKPERDIHVLARRPACIVIIVVPLTVICDVRKAREGKQTMSSVRSAHRAGGSAGPVLRSVGRATALPEWAVASTEAWVEWIAW